LAVVVIGRNEGERLQRCLNSALAYPFNDVVVYVDSGSTDGSVEFALGLGCQVVQLDLSIPFTAARARNEGFARALKICPDLSYVQFVDGDCELAQGWQQVALQFLQEHSAAAAVCGRRRERYPQRSIYNQLCDIEWNTPVGLARSFGGDVMIHADALRQAKGYRASLIAGEEPELCVRLRAVGWKIWRIDHEMTLHDAAILRFGQWWKRSTRTGYAFAEGAALHGAPPERHWVRESRSAWIWGAIFPVLALAGAAFFNLGLLGLLALYPLQILRIFLGVRTSLPRPGWYATFLVIGKFPECLGQLQFLRDRVLGKKSRLIEYK
jgi:glycosyltransferase involved in cell wall biosynthesis